MNCFRWSGRLCLLVSLTMLLSCHKEVAPKLPPETRSGAHTFGCLINGKVFVPGAIRHLPNHR